MYETETLKGKIVKIFGYLSCVLKRKKLALLLDIKLTDLYTLQSSLKKDYYFILDNDTHTLLAVFDLNCRNMLIGYNYFSKKIMDEKFKTLNGSSERMLTELLDFINLLDTPSFKPVLIKKTIYKYLLILNDVEYVIQKNNYIYEHEMNGLTYSYSQESYVTIIDNKLKFLNNIPCLFLVSDANDLTHKNLAPFKNDTDIIIKNVDLDIVFDDLKYLVTGKSLINSSKFVLHEYDKSINLMKEFYLNSYYNGWQEIGYPQTKEDIQLLKMIAI